MPSQLYTSCDHDEDWRFVECSKYPWGELCLWHTLEHSLCQVTNKSTRARMHTHTHRRIHTHASHTHIHMHNHMHACTHTHTHSHIHTQAFIHTHTYTLHTHMHTPHIHTLTPRHAHAHTHTHTHRKREDWQTLQSLIWKHASLEPFAKKAEEDDILSTPWRTAAECPHHNKEPYVAQRGFTHAQGS